MIFVSAFLAGVLGIFSPCVLPLIPIIFLSAWQKHALGPLALGLGLNVTFISLGLGLIQSGLFSFDLQKGSLFFMTFIALWLIFDKVHQMIIKITNPLIAPFQHLSQRIGGEGLLGLFVLGLLLGIVWTPCMGATLGYAITLAGQGEHLWKAVFIMLSYSLGLMLPLMTISYVSHYFVTGGQQKKTLQIANKAKIILGWVLLLWVVLILMDWDKVIEQVIVRNMSTQWLNWTSK